MTSHNCQQWLVAGLVCFIVDLGATSTVEDGVIVAYNTNSTLRMFCLRYFPKIFQLPLQEHAYAHPLRDLTPWTGCKKNDVDSADLKALVKSMAGEVVVIEEPINCTLLEKVKAVEEMGGSGVIVVDSHVPFINRSEHVRLNISLAIISDDSFQHIKALGPDVQVIQYAVEKSSRLDFSLAVVWLIAMFCVILGAYWESIVKKGTMRLPVTQHDSLTGEASVSSDNRCIETHRQETVQLTSAIAVIILVICMCVMLLLIYFFYTYLVYVLIAFYCLGSASSLHQLCSPFLILFPCGKLWVRKALLFLFWASFAVTWFFLRKQSYAWILQNFLGVGILVNILNVLRFPSFKIITILLSLLFLYDIFFVFITPLFTKNGESVMVEAASGGEGSGEQMPMVFKVPNFFFYSLCATETHYLFLGLGDILFPGLLVGYCFRFDTESPTNLYFITSVIAYGCGLLFTFVGLFLMSSAQPALLYLVPTMLLTSAAVAFFRKEFCSFWVGSLAGSQDYDNDEEETEVEVANSVDDVQTDETSRRSLNAVEDGKLLNR